MKRNPRIFPTLLTLGLAVGVAVWLMRRRPGVAAVARPPRPPSIQPPSNVSQSIPADAAGTKGVQVGTNFAFDPTQIQRRGEVIKFDNPLMKT
jgi:hypothetical protein